MLILLINIGDLFTGVYLLNIAVMDTIVYGSNYCTERLEWLTSAHCSLIGVISTVGYQISLVSMTNLGLARLAEIKNGSMISYRVNKRAILSIFLLVTSIVLMSVIIAVTPLLEQFEDFFVNGMTYNPSARLFIGAPRKEIHLSVLQEYYGNIKGKNLKWAAINDLVSGMFSNDYGGDTLGRRKLEFYGNEGVCLFKFLVKEDDPQRVYTWTVLTMNLICFLIISVCYFLINTIAKASSRVLTQEKSHTGQEARKRNRRLQQKISVIIATNLLCWLPVIIVSCLHSGGVVDATPHYPIISIVFLPINSVINPVLYSEFFSGLWSRACRNVACIFIRNRKEPGISPNHLSNKPKGNVVEIEMSKMNTIQKNGDSILTTSRTEMNFTK